MAQYKGDFCITDDLHAISNAYFEHKIELGNGKKYGLWWAEQPYVVIEVKESANPFDDAYIYRNQVYIGNNDEMVVVDLSTLDYQIFQVNVYFGYFYEYAGLLFVASGVDVICFQEDGEIKWQTEMIAVDGITFLGCDGEHLEVSCCMEPCPAIWCDKSISVESGNVLDN